jgi:hypothetical protein
MFLYDWKKIVETAEGSPLAVYLIFKMLVMKEIPTNKYDKIYKYVDLSFAGESFLVNPEQLVFESYKYGFREISQYLALASIRPISEYYATGKVALDQRLVEVEEELYEDNSLLRIEDGQIHFLYEEVPAKEKLH